MILKSTKIKHMFGKCFNSATVSPYYYHHHGCQFTDRFFRIYDFYFGGAASTFQLLL